MRPIPLEICLGLIKHYEGFRAYRYRDPAGYQTIGYGHKLTGPNDPYWGATLSEASAEELAEKDLEERAAKPLCDDLGPDVLQELSDGQYAALIDFVFNEGIEKFHTSTLRHFVLTGNHAAACDELPKWKYAHVLGEAVVLDGLVKRRAAEQAVWRV